MLARERHVEFVAVGSLHVGVMNPRERLAVFLSARRVLHAVDDLVGILQCVLLVAIPEIGSGKS